jgi:hypothetical protein
VKVKTLEGLKVSGLSQKPRDFGFLINGKLQTFVAFTAQGFNLLFK